MEIEVTSIEEYIRAVNQLSDKSKSYTMFFRGHADKQWTLKPSLLRNEGYIASEHLLYRTIVAKHTSEFATCTSTLDHLVKMQHYGLPTRLLDLTTNPLVALYFACEEFQAYDKIRGKPGEVILLKVPTSSIKHYDSDTVAILANIAKCKESEMRIRLYPDDWSEGNFYAGLPLGKDARRKFQNHIGLYYQKAILDLLPSVRSDDERLGVLLRSLQEVANSNKLRFPSFYDTSGRLKPRTQLEMELKRITMTPHGKGLLSRLRSYLAKETEFSEGWERYVTWFNGLGQTKLLLHQITQEKGHFLPRIDPYDLGRVYVVNSKQDNQRIRNQMGAFILFGLGVSEEPEGLVFSKRGESQIPEEWDLSSQTKLIIPPKSKRRILEALERFGITRSFIYPELEELAKELGKQHKK